MSGLFTHLLLGHVHFAERLASGAAHCPHFCRNWPEVLLSAHSPALKRAALIDANGTIIGRPEHIVVRKANNVPVADQCVSHERRTQLTARRVNGARLPIERWVSKRHNRREPPALARKCNPSRPSVSNRHAQSRINAVSEQFRRNPVPIPSVRLNEPPVAAFVKRPARPITTTGRLTNRQIKAVIVRNDSTNGFWVATCLRGRDTCRHVPRTPTPTRARKS